tara:strand:- start:193 stop:480 length:288 start_codon:yes stop_codon:yes gene_type:complete
MASSIDVENSIQMDEENILLESEENLFTFKNLCMYVINCMLAFLIITWCQCEIGVMVISMILLIILCQMRDAKYYYNFSIKKEKIKPSPNKKFIV